MGDKPVENGGRWQVRAISSNLIQHRQPVRLDTGVDMKVESGFYPVFELADELAIKGLVATGGVVSARGRIEPVVVNCGHEIIQIKACDTIGTVAVCKG
jgi:hypothetical protein